MMIRRRDLVLHLDFYNVLIVLTTHSCYAHEKRYVLLKNIALVFVSL
jgi:hypothetical protein